MHGLVERRELIALRCVAEEGVQNLFDRAQVGAHFRDNLVHEQPFLRLARHLVEQGELRRGAPELAEHAVFQARTQKLRLLGKLAGEMRETGKRIFEQQERRCDFERDDLAHVFAVRGEPRGDLGDLAGERREICVAQVLRVVLERGRTVAECEQRGRIA